MEKVKIVTCPQELLYGPIRRLLLIFNHYKTSENLSKSVIKRNEVPLLSPSQ